MAEIYFVDIVKVGKDYTGNKDLSVITNEQAILESVINILITEPGERVMNPMFGCKLRAFLFEPIDDVTAVYIRKEIEYAIETFEPRIEELQVNVIPDEDNNTYIINIFFTMKVIKSTQNITISLNKIR